MILSDTRHYLAVENTRRQFACFLQMNNYTPPTISQDQQKETKKSIRCFALTATAIQIDSIKSKAGLWNRTI